MNNKISVVSKGITVVRTVITSDEMTRGTKNKRKLQTWHTDASELPATINAGAQVLAGV